VEPGVEGGWSVQQIVAQIAGYQAWAAAFLSDRRDRALAPLPRSTRCGSTNSIPIAKTTLISPHS
jgi:hypothetical protein